jgi:hypothetical protein
MDNRINNEFNNSHVCDHLVQCICRSSNLIQYTKGAASPKKEKKETVNRQESTEITSPLTKNTEETKETKPKRSSKLAL